MDPSDVAVPTVLVVEHVHRHVQAARASQSNDFAQWSAGYVSGLVVMIVCVGVVAAFYPDAAVRVVERLSKAAGNGLAGGIAA